MLALAGTGLFAQKKLAQTGFQFLSVGTNARATAMGEAFTTFQGSSEAMFYNPAGIGGMTGTVDVTFNQMTWIADIKYQSVTSSFSFKNGKFGVLGLSYITVDYGEFLWTQVADTKLGYEDIFNDTWSESNPGIGLPDPSAHVLGVGYAIQLSDRFTVGGQIKYVYQNLGKSYVPVYAEDDTTFTLKQYDKGLPAFDFGTIYQTGFRSLAFGMTVRNFAEEVKYEKEGFQLPLTFRIGISMDLFDVLPIDADYHSFMIALDAVHPRSYPEFFSIGGEYEFMDMMFLRLGYISNQDQYDFTAGVGFNIFGLGIDYSYMPFSVFDTVNRLSFKFAL
jgi:hypothetical protein